MNQNNQRSDSRQQRGNSQRSRAGRSRPCRRNCRQWPRHGGKNGAQANPTRAGAIAPGSRPAREPI